MNEKERTFIELLYDRQPTIFYLSLISIISILTIYFVIRFYFFGVFSLQENAKIIFYLILQFSSIYYEYYQAFKHNDVLRLSSLLIPFSLFNFSLCAYIKLESIIFKYDKQSKDSNKKIVRLIVCIIFTFGFIECYLYILNDKLYMKSQEKATFFIFEKSCLSIIKKPIILALYHAQTINIFTVLNYIAFIINIQIKTDRLFTININWFLNSLHELFQAFLSIHLSDNILFSIPDFLFHASFAIFYFLKQETFATLIQFIKEFFLIFWNDDDKNKAREEDIQNNIEINEEIINIDNSIINDSDITDNNNNDEIFDIQNEVFDIGENNSDYEKMDEKDETVNNNIVSCDVKDKFIHKEDKIANDPSSFANDVEITNNKEETSINED